MAEEKQALRTKIEEIKNIPTLPGVITKVTAMIHDPHVSTEKLGQVISKDQVLSARVLKLINSAFYGFPGRISSVSHAMVLLGFNVIKGMLISTSVFDMMHESMIELWQHSLGCATLSGITARKLGEPEAEEVFIAGLLHDIGKVIIKVSQPEDAKKIAQITENEGIFMREAEERVLGVDHAQIADWVAQKWNLPDNIGEPMTLHHAPLSSQKFSRRTAIVHLADILIQTVGFGNSGNTFVPGLEPSVLDILEVDMGFIEGVLLALEENMDSLTEFTMED